MFFISRVSLKHTTRPPPSFAPAAGCSTAGTREATASRPLPTRRVSLHFSAAPTPTDQLLRYIVLRSHDDRQRVALVERCPVHRFGRQLRLVHWGHQRAVKELRDAIRQDIAGTCTQWGR